MAPKWVNLADLAAAGQPDDRDHHSKRVYSKRAQFPRVRLANSDDREADRPGYRDQENDPDRKDDREDVEGR